jgi:hypothetical protein
VSIPNTIEDLMDSIPEFKQAEFPGCMSSSDATPVIYEKCHSRLMIHYHAKSKMAINAFSYCCKLKVKYFQIQLLDFLVDEMMNLLFCLMDCFPECTIKH